MRTRNVHEHNKEICTVNSYDSAVGRMLVQGGGEQPSTVPSWREGELQMRQSADGPARVTGRNANMQ